VERSRREVFTTHAGDRDRLARCPICRMAIEKDHEEALEVVRVRTGLERDGVRRPGVWLGIRRQPGAIA
jgi:hypothetical protein